MNSPLATSGILPAAFLSSPPSYLLTQPLRSPPLFREVPSFSAGRTAGPILPFCNYLNHQLFACLPHGQFVPFFLPLPSHSSEACSGFSCSTALSSQLPSQRHSLDNWDKAEDSLSLQGTQQHLSPSVSPNSRAREGLQCHTAGRGYAGWWVCFTCSVSSNVSLPCSPPPLLLA